MKFRIVIVLFTFLASINIYSQDQNVSNGLLFDGEPYLAINPNNTEHYVVAWMSVQIFESIVIRTKVSFDAGLTWSDAQYFNHVEAGYQSADVSLAFDNEGNVYAAYVDYDGIMASGGGIYVRKSTDGGLSWGEAVEAVHLDDCPDKLCIDRPWMVVDTSNGPNEGAIYVTSMNAKLLPVAPPYNPYFVVSTDGGASFTTPQTLDDEGFLSGNIIPQPMPTPTIGADGTFHALYPSYVLSQSIFAQYILASSSDTGSNFDYTIAAQGGGGSNDTLPKLGGLLKADPSDENHLAAFFALTINEDIDIFMIETTDGSESWTEPLRVNDDPINNGAMQDLVWADFNNEGDLAVCWRDRRNSGEEGYEVPSEIYGTVLWKDSLSFSPNFPVSSVIADHDVILNGAGNDFMCLELIDDTLNAVWGDIRTGVLSIWLNKINLSDGTMSLEEIVKEDHLLEINPNPAYEYIRLSNDLTNFKYSIFDLKGQLIMEGISKSNQLDIVTIAPGAYVITVIKNDYISSGKFIKQE